MRDKETEALVRLLEEMVKKIDLLEAKVEIHHRTFERLNTLMDALIQIKEEL